MPVTAPRGRTAIEPKAIGAAEHALLIQAITASNRGDSSRARFFASQAGSSAMQLIVEWRSLVDDASGSNFDALNGFMTAHPNWPRRDIMIMRAEKAMPADYAPQRVIAWYGKRTPTTGDGMVRLGDALIATGKSAQGAALVRKAWIQSTFPQAEETLLLRTHGHLIGRAEHRARLEYLLARDDLVNAKRQLQRVDADAQRVAQARMRLKAIPAAVKPVLTSLPESLKNNPEFLFDAARALRRMRQDTQAWDTMLKAPSDRSALVLPEHWWTERHIMTRDALKAGKYDVAYKLVSKHALDAGTNFADAEFLAGWIALRFLNKPLTAMPHFQALAAGVTLPISQSRAYYWLGRTEEVLDLPANALADYRKAAENPETYYGQLALARIADDPRLHLDSVAEETTSDVEAAFAADDRVQAIRVLADVHERDMMRLFAIRMANDPPEPKRLQLLARLMLAVGDRAMSVRVAKYASYGDVLLLPYLDPVISLPRLAADASMPEPALVLGLTRQESEFDSTAVSSAGARGLMQLMPNSAKRTAAMHRVPFRQNDLLTNPQYNMQIGMTALGDLVQYWGGSYILAIASYNAGPGNVRDWIDAFGDPRDPTVDPIDWVELIPFGETRNYVQRVIENIEVYRNRLGGGDQRLAILSDLYRPGAPKTVVLKMRPPASVASPAPTDAPTVTSPAPADPAQSVSAAPIDGTQPAMIVRPAGQ
jgi:soluble lytic murein transglycosylase